MFKCQTSFGFDSLKNTQVDLEGTLAGLTNPNAAGGNITIRKLHTSQSDIALFTGSRLSTPDINIPETFDIRGNISGYSARLRANVIINSSAGDFSKTLILSIDLVNSPMIRS